MKKKQRMSFNVYISKKISSIFSVQIHFKSILKYIIHRGLQCGRFCQMNARQECPKRVSLIQQSEININNNCNFIFTVINNMVVLVKNKTQI